MADILMYGNEQIGVAGPADASELPYDSTQSTKQKIDEVDAKAQNITGSFASSAGDVIKNYPTGFTYSNCIVVGFMAEMSASRWDTIPNHNYKNVNVSLRNNGIYVYTSEESLFGKAFSFELIKI